MLRDTGLLQPKLFRVRSSAGRDQNAFGDELLLLAIAIDGEDGICSSLFDAPVGYAADDTDAFVDE